jgi:hypothetical protein
MKSGPIFCLTRAFRPLYRSSLFNLLGKPMDRKNDLRPRYASPSNPGSPRPNPKLINRSRLELPLGFAVQHVPSWASLV